MGIIKVGLDEQHWEIDLDELTLKDLFAIKGACGLGLQPFLAGIEDLDPDCLQTLVWFCRRPAEAGLQRNAVEFNVTKLRVEMSGPTTSRSATPPTGEQSTSTSSTDGADSQQTTSTASPPSTSTASSEASTTS